LTDRSLWREPLVHFLLIGLALFLFYRWVAPPAQEPDRIVVDASALATLASQFEATWSRPPTDAELAGLVDSYVRDEVLYREGVALGLARDDAVIKRRVRQKLEVLAEEESSALAPTEAELAAHLKDNPERFRQPPVLSFEQVVFDAPAPGDGSGAALEAAKAALKEGADPGTVGRRSMLPGRSERRPLDLVAREFGDEFAHALADAPTQEWFGPVPSVFGVHLVRISERTPGYLPTLDEARKAVTSDWENTRRQAAVEANYQRLLEGYEVVVESGSQGSKLQ
jgi:hypothetical protein